MRAWIATFILAGCAPASAEPKQTAAPPGEIVTARLELVRRRVLSGYYGSPAIAAEVARRLMEQPPRRERK